MDAGTFGDAGLDNRSDGRLLHVGEHLDRHLAAALEQTQDRRLLLGQRTAPGRPSQPASSPAQVQCWIATTAGSGSLSGYIPLRPALQPQKPNTGPFAADKMPTTMA